MCQADTTKRLLSLDHPEARKHEKGRGAFSLLNREKNPTQKEKAPTSSVQLIKGQIANHSYKFSSERA